MVFVITSGTASFTITKNGTVTKRVIVVIYIVDDLIVAHDCDSSILLHHLLVRPLIETVSSVITTSSSSDLMKHPMPRPNELLYILLVVRQRQCLHTSLTSLISTDASRHMINASVIALRVVLFDPDLVLI